MSRVLKRIHGSGTAGAWVDQDPFTATAGFTPLRDSLDLLLAASLQKNLFVGGSDVVGLSGEATGDQALLAFAPWLVDNSSNQLSGFTDAHSATLVVQVRYLLRVSNAGISLTPKIWYGSSMSAITTAATISGAAACSATADDYSGTNQVQTVMLTLPSGVKYFKAGVTVGGTPAAGYQGWARAYFDLFVQL